MRFSCCKPPKNSCLPQVNHESSVISIRGFRWSMTTPNGRLQHCAKPYSGHRIDVDCQECRIYEASNHLVFEDEATQNLLGGTARISVSSQIIGRVFKIPCLTKLMLFIRLMRHRSRHHPNLLQVRVKMFMSLFSSTCDWYKSKSSQLTSLV